MAALRPLRTASAIICMVAAAAGMAVASPSGSDEPALDNLSGIGKATAGLSPARIEEALRKAGSDSTNVLRAPALGLQVGSLGRPVALVVTPARLGSATLVGANGRFITSWNVVRGEAQVGLIFMPASADNRPTEADAVTATVVKSDPARDLALLELTPAPQDLKPVPLAVKSSLHQGMPLRIVGHPYGEIWSMSEGRINTALRNHAWTSPAGTAHRANVIRFRSTGATGNAGDPVFNAKGHLVAMDVSPADQTTLTSIAVTAAEIRRFMLAPPPIATREAPASKASAMPRLAPPSPPPPPAPPPPPCRPQQLDTSRNAAANATLRGLDLDCNGRSDAQLLLPDDPKAARTLALDADNNGVPEATYLDLDRDGRFDEVRFDTNGDGKPDLRGTDLDATLVPRRTRALQP